MAEFYLSTQQHQELLNSMSSNLGSLQSWLVGEVSWIDSIIFYTSVGLLFVLFTSTKRTVSARLPILFLVITNSFVERLLYFSISFHEGDFASTQETFVGYIWWCRRVTVTLCLVLLTYKAYSYVDFDYENNEFLKKIYKQNLGFSEILDQMKVKNSGNDHVAIVKERRTSYNNNEISQNTSSFVHGNSFSSNGLGFAVDAETDSPSVFEVDASNRNVISIGGRERIRSVTPKAFQKGLLPLIEMESNGRYNFRSRQGTPNSTII